MLESIKEYLKTWDWKCQWIGSDENWKNLVEVSTLIAQIERGCYKTKEVEIDLSVYNLWSYSFWTDDLFDFITHYKLVENANLKYPVILNRRWSIIDGRHRLCKAIIKWKKKLKWIMILDSDIL